MWLSSTKKEEKHANWKSWVLKIHKSSDARHPCLKVHAVYCRIFTCTPVFEAGPTFEMVCTGSAFWFPSLKRIKPYRLTVRWTSDPTALAKHMASKLPSLPHCSAYSPSSSNPPCGRGALVIGLRSSAVLLQLPYKRWKKSNWKPTYLTKARSTGWLPDVTNTLIN